MKFRYAKAQDIPTLKTLWKLAFHDEGDYLENFFHTYGKPEKILVATSEENSQDILAMTAYFPSTLHRQNQSHPMAYLYAVATHPNHEKKGIASQLLHYVYQEMAILGFQGVTTVPANPSLHNFFQKNGFQEYFLQEEIQCQSTPDLSHATAPNLQKSQNLTNSCTTSAHPLTAQEYKTLHRAFFQTHAPKLSYISLEEDGFHYQKTASQLAQGDLFFLGEKPTSPISPHAPFPQGCLCTLERADIHQFWVKEWLCPPSEEETAKKYLQTLLHSLLNTQNTQNPLPNTPLFQPVYHPNDNATKFGMIQWLTPPPNGWNPIEEETAFLGLAFN